MRLALGFADLFDRLGTEEVRYSTAAKRLSGREITIEGYLSHAHGPRGSMLLVDQPGVCPGLLRRCRRPSSHSMARLRS